MEIVPEAIGGNNLPAANSYFRCSNMDESPDFNNLVAHYYEPLYRFAFSLARDESDACDLVQQAFYIWAAKGHQLRDASKVKTWLFTTLHREFLESKRRQIRFQHVELDSVVDELPLAPPLPSNRLDTAHVVEALTLMNETYRAPVTLFYLQDCSYNEIAEILQVPLGTVKSRLSRGLAQLQQLLARDIAAGGRST
jgi:RNA polymerase sigma-70 factor (ECF subfamily)